MINLSLPLSTDLLIPKHIKNHKAPNEKLYKRWLQLCHTYYEIMIRELLQLLKNTVTQISDACNLWENLALVQNLVKRKPKVQTRLHNNGLPLLQNSWHGRPNVGIFRAKVVDQKGPRSYQPKCRGTSPEESTLLSSWTKYLSTLQNQSSLQIELWHDKGLFQIILGRLNLTIHVL